MSQFHLASVLLSIAILTSILFLLNTLLQHIGKPDARPGWISGLLCLSAVLSGTGTLLLSIGEDAQFVFAAMMLVVGIAEVALGATVYLLLERRRGLLASQSFGPLYLVIGFYALVAAVFIPLLPGQFRQESAAPLVEVSPTAILIPTIGSSASPTIQLMSTLTAVPSSPTQLPTTTATPPASPTRIRYSTPTSIPTSVPEVVCGALTNFNVNLRATPALDSEILAVIPYQTVIQIGGRAGQTNWWLAVYQSRWGWVVWDYLILDTMCDQAPVVSP